MTVPKGLEGGVGEVGQDECQGVSEIGVEEVDEENSKDDCMNGLSFHFSRFASVSAGNVVCTHRRVQDQPA